MISTRDDEKNDVTVSQYGGVTPAPFSWRVIFVYSFLEYPI